MLDIESIKNTVIHGDCLEVMKQIPDGSVDLTVTSPPYDNLRTYNWFSWDFEWIAKELYRITKEWWVVVWVVWDATEKFCESMTSFKQALYFNKIWFNLLDTMIYYKQNYAPAYPTLRRYANQFEYMFIFSKGKPKTFNPIQKEKVRMASGMSSFSKKDGSKIVKYVDRNTRLTKDASNVWEYPSSSKNQNHPAVFPEKLAEDHILSRSNELDLIFDPFMWSWTTAVACINTKRNFIWIEISQEYIEIINKRLECITPSLF